MAEAAPADLRERLATIPRDTDARREPGRRRGFTLLAVAAVLIVGGAVAAAGSGLLRLSSVVPPTPSQALLASPGPSPSETATETPAITPSPTANIQPGDTIAFTRNVDKKRPSCSRQRAICPTSRLWVVGADGQGAHELDPDGLGNQVLLGWSSDGTRLLYTEDQSFYLADANGGRPQPLDTGCPPQAAPTPSTCQRDARSRSRPMAGTSSSFASRPTRPGSATVCDRDDGSRDRQHRGAGLDAPVGGCATPAGRRTAARSSSRDRGDKGPGGDPSG